MVRLMGHGSKKMIYEVYGNYIEGLDEDLWQILEYFGRDFAEPKKKVMPSTLEYQSEPATLIPFPQAA
jgi:integrase